MPRQVQSSLFKSNQVKKTTLNWHISWELDKFYMKTFRANVVKWVPSKRCCKCKWQILNLITIVRLVLIFCFYSYCILSLSYIYELKLYLNNFCFFYYSLHLRIGPTIGKSNNACIFPSVQSHVAAVKEANCTIIFRDYKVCFIDQNVCTHRV